MKKRRKQQSDLKDTWANLVDKVSNIPQRLEDAFEEGMQEEIAETLDGDFRSIRNGVLNFDLIEKDIQQFHQNLEIRGSRVLGSHLILDDQRNVIEIQTYTKKEGKTYRTINSAKVHEITNIPDEVLNELDKKQIVELRYTSD